MAKTPKLGNPNLVPRRAPVARTAADEIGPKMHHDREAVGAAAAGKSRSALFKRVTTVAVFTPDVRFLSALGTLFLGPGCRVRFRLGIAASLVRLAFPFGSKLFGACRIGLQDRALRMNSSIGIGPFATDGTDLPRFLNSPRRRLLLAHRGLPPGMHAPRSDIHEPFHARATRNLTEALDGQIQRVPTKAASGVVENA